MTIPAIQEKMKAEHEAFLDMFENMKEDDFLYAPAEKWRMGQHLEHIIKSAQPVWMALQLSRADLEKRFGISDHVSVSPEELKASYQSKLSGGAKAPTGFVPEEISYDKRKDYTGKLFKIVEGINSAMKDYSEEELDRYVLPHPLLGNLTLREMLYFTFLHVRHHQQLVEKYLKESF